MSMDQQILDRFALFAKSLVGESHGWQKRFAEKSGMSTSQINNILSGRAPIGLKIRERLISLGCDRQWLDTGIAKQSVKIGGAVYTENDRQMLEYLYSLGVTTPQKLTEFLSPRRYAEGVMSVISEQLSHYDSKPCSSKKKS